MADNLPEPESRKEQYLAKAAGMTVEDLPTPASREELYLNAIAEGGGGSSYTAGDGIDISNNEISVDTTTIQPKLTAGTNITIDADNVISAEGEAETFGYRKLTVDDYNWNKTTNTTENPDCIALWLLPSGVYYGPNSAELGGTSKALTNRTHSAYDSGGHVWRVYRSNGTGVAHIYEWYSGNNTYIRCFTTYTNGNPGSGSAADGAIIQTSDILAKTTGGNDTVAITQKAATSLVYADPTAGTRIKMGASASLVSGNSNVATAIGNRAKATGANSVAISGNKDFDATASGTTSLMVGRGTASGIGSVAIGIANASGSGSVCVSGNNNSASNTYATAINGNASGIDSVAIGFESSATAVGSVALGANSSATTTGVVAIGSTSTSLGYNTSNYRLLTGLYDGQSAHDAVTVEQVNATIDAINTALSTSIPHIGA